MSRTLVSLLAEEEPTIVIQQMPTLSNKQQPSIAVITSNYYEKLAVDAMMEDKTTYVKFQAVGKSACTLVLFQLPLSLVASTSIYN